MIRVCVVAPAYMTGGQAIEARTLIDGFALSVRQSRPAQLGIAAAMSGARIRPLPNPLAMRPQLARYATPMLAAWEWGHGRVAAFAPDVSPHWAGGIVDWGEQRLILPNGAEIGHLYRAFLLDLCGWLEGK